jgi:hypothetical protein
MQFALTDTQAKLTSFTGRTEMHGDERVPAVSIGITITAPNTILDTLAPGLRQALYKVADNQEQLPGVEPSTPLLRAQGVGSLSLDKSFEGWTVVLDHGIGEDSAIRLGSAKVDSFKVQPHEGGSIDLSFRAGTSALDAEAAGLLWSKNGQNVVITLEPPAPKQEAIDGTGEAFAADHPEQGDLLDDEAPAMDATDAFIASADVRH